MNLTCRPFRPRDIPELFSWFETESAALQWAGANMSWPLKPSEMRALIKLHKGKAPKRQVWAFDIDTAMVGHAQIGYNTRLRMAAIGRIAIAPAQRGKGLAAPMLTQILDKAFARPWVHRAELSVYSHNQAALKAYTRAGFELEGTRRQTTPINAQFWDTHMMSVLREEFDKRTEQE